MKSIERQMKTIRTVWSDMIPNSPNTYAAGVTSSAAHVPATWSRKGVIRRLTKVWPILATEARFAVTWAMPLASRKWARVALYWNSMQKKR